MTPRIHGASSFNSMQFRHRQLDLSQPQVMGILNVTPDSFSDGGHYDSVEAAFAQARQMYAEGAAIIDVGGESTRPGAQPVSEQQELDRVLPVIECIAGELDVIVSIDTSKPGVMREAVAAGAHMVNDVLALREPTALATVAGLGVPVCLMHMQGEPRTMQASPVYQDVVGEISTFLQQRVEACLAAGIVSRQILLDPGFGFGKTLDHNLSLFRQLPALVELGFPVMVGVSRKSMLGSILDRPVSQRLHGSVGLASLAVWLGASIIRAHDVGPTRDAIRAVQAVKTHREESHGA